MKIGIFSRNPKLYSTSVLAGAAKARGHEVMVIDPLKCYMNIEPHQPTIHYKKKALTGFDAIIPRLGASVTFYATAVLRQLEMMGVYTLNDSGAITRSRDKLRALQLLARKGIGLPITGFAHSTEMTDDLIDLVGGPPLVIKLLDGSQGNGVVLAENRGAAESVIDAFRKLDNYFLVQEFIQEAEGSDIRCFVLGDRVVASMKRQAREGEFRSNLHRGALATAVKISTEERNTALRAAQVMSLELAAVDLVRSHRGPLVLQVHSSPGLEGIERATHTDIASLVIEFVEKRVEAKRAEGVSKAG